MAAGGFVDVKNPADIGAEDFFERALHGYATEMQDGVDAFDQVVYRVFVGQVAGLHFFIGAGGGHVDDIRQAQHLGIWPKAFA